MGETMSRFHKILVQELGHTLFTELVSWHTNPRKQSRGSFSFFTVNHHFQLELDTMPRKKKDNTHAKETDNQAAGETLVWVNVKFEPDEVQWITELSTSSDQIGTRLAQLLIMGVGFSIKPNALRGNYSAFVVGLELEGIGKNCGISAYAPDALTAACAVLAKVALLQADSTRGNASGASVGIG